MELNILLGDAMHVAGLLLCVNSGFSSDEMSMLLLGWKWIFIAVITRRRVVAKKNVSIPV